LILFLDYCQFSKIGKYSYVEAILDSFLELIFNNYQ